MEISPDHLLRRYWEPLALALLVVVLFGRVVVYDFVNWDDQVYLIQNQAIQTFAVDHVRAIITPGGLPGERLYIPVTYLSHLLESVVFGFSPRVIHAVNLLLHVLNVLLVLGLVRRWTERPLVPFVTAVIFACHPLQVEAVAWCMGRKELLAACFALLALHAWHAYLDDRRGAGMATCGFFAVSLLSKPSAVLLPLVLLLLAFVMVGRVRRRDGLLAGGLMCLSGGAFWLTLRLAEAGSGLVLQGVVLQAAYVPGILVGWLRRLLLMEPPAPLYLLNDLDPASISVAMLLPSLALLGLIALAIRDRRHRAWFGLVLALLTFAPAFSLMIQRNRDFITADRYAYLPMLGLAFPVAMLIGVLAGKWRTAYVTLLSVFLLVGIVRTWPLVSSWYDSEALWTRTLALQPHNPIAVNSLGNHFGETGDWNRAIPCWEQAATLRTDSINPRLNLAAVCFSHEQRGEGLRQLRHAFIIAPSHPQVSYLLEQYVSPAERLALLYASPSILLRQPESMVQLAALMTQAQQYRQAASLYRRLLVVQPENSSVWKAKLESLPTPTATPPPEVGP